MPKSSAFYTETSFTVDNKFTEITLLHPSENGYSEVYKALRHGKWLILKRLTEQETSNPRYQQLLEKEFEVSYQLSHPGIVHTIGIEEVAGLGECIIQEFIDGTTWDDFFHKEIVTGRERRRIISELCLAIDYIHQRQIVHRDLTPGNILITRDGHHPCIIDFGLADSGVFVYLKEPAGTTGYASPEQQRPGRLDNRSDIYSLGVLIDGLASGGFKEGQKISCAFKDFRLHRIARRCLANNPEKRFVSAKDIHRMLEPVKWWRVMVSIMLGMIIAMAVLWHFSGRDQEMVIERLQYQVAQQEHQSQMQQQRIRVQQERIKEMSRSVKQMSSAVDSVQTFSKGVSQRMEKEDSQAEALEQAKKELHTIADEQYQRIWNSHTELADQPSRRRTTTNHEIYLVDWHPIVARLIRKYHLGAGRDVNKVLMDEWLIALYDKVKS